MKVFISSVIGGLEEARDAAAAGIETLGSQPKRAEDFGASPDTPQRNVSRAFATQTPSF